MTYYGRLTRLGVGEESPWGTPVTRTNWHSVVSVDLQSKENWVPIPHLANCDTAFMPQKKASTKTDVQGSIDLMLRYTGCGMFFKAAMGSIADAGAPTTYTHTFTLGDPTTSLVGLTLEVIRGDSTYSEVFAGCKIGKMTLSIASYDYAKLRLDVIGKSAAARGAAGTPTDGDETWVYGHQAGALSWNSATWTVRSLEIIIDNKLAAREALGSKLTQQPLPSALRDVTVKCVLEAVDAAYTAFLAGTEGDMTVTFTGDSPNKLEVTAHNAYIKSCSDPINQQGIITQTVEWTCQSDNTDKGLKLIFTNSDATYDIN